MLKLNQSPTICVLGVSIRSVRSCFDEIPSTFSEFCKKGSEYFEPINWNPSRIFSSPKSRLLLQWDKVCECVAYWIRTVVFEPLFEPCLNKMREEFYSAELNTMTWSVSVQKLFVYFDLSLIWFDLKEWTHLHSPPFHPSSPKNIIEWLLARISWIKFEQHCDAFHSHGHKHTHWLAAYSIKCNTKNYLRRAIQWLLIMNLNLCRHFHKMYFKLWMHGVRCSLENGTERTVAAHCMAVKACWNCLWCQFKWWFNFHSKILRTYTRMHV